MHDEKKRWLAYQLVFQPHPHRSDSHCACGGVRWRGAGHKGCREVS